MTTRGTDPMTHSRDLTAHKYRKHLGDSMAHSATRDYQVTRYYPNTAVCVIARIAGVS